MIFYLSHAHAARGGGAPDPWVRRFFDALSDAVHARTGDGGFHDGQLAPGADSKQQLTAALGQAQVFVPLYSPQYFNNSWAVAELTSFRSRLRGFAPAEAARHIVPVVWTPLPPWAARPEVDEAFGLVGKSVEYSENGMRALCMLSVYRDAYRDLVTRFADRIAAVVHESPLAPSAAAPPVPRPPDTGEPALLVSLLAAEGSGYDLPALAGRVLAAAERLGVPALQAPPDQVRRQAGRRPCVLLIDAGAGPETVRATVTGLPGWVIALVVASASAATGALTGILRTAGLPRVSPVRTVAEFERTAPLLVTEARKQYLRHGPVVTAPGSPRPSLRRTVDDKRG
ncbi:TIR-like protein FxsC [Actinoplanes teichomyceticus]|uniref:TIR domain-containing protein n=1 Tax=Actinoplanes teichomyceticus TaxID=1867 RepID=A0A561VLM7_ACTTI|nr:TIR-like protein FxsC [Actinoplanes teichomyceticus]TWG12504.1 TIR domain-containing protein [Actinoplanes teichomyceticus]GIF13868.1 hypothetical protein Ate01nite_39000 [Actinoplanes teichomyceticus]